MSQSSSGIAAPPEECSEAAIKPGGGECFAGGSAVLLPSSPPRFARWPGEIWQCLGLAFSPGRGPWGLFPVRIPAPLPACPPSQASQPEASRLLHSQHPLSGESWGLTAQQNDPLLADSDKKAPLRPQESVSNKAIR